MVRCVTCKSKCKKSPNAHKLEHICSKVEEAETTIDDLKDRIRTFAKVRVFVCKVADEPRCLFSVTQLTDVQYKAKQQSTPSLYFKIFVTVEKKLR